jgi:hypothetical protein
LSRCGVSALAVAGLLAMGSAAMADLVAYEGFDYPAGSSLANQTGGFGWRAGSAWTLGGSADNNQIIAGSFTYDDGFGNIVTTTGNRVHSTGNGVADGLPGSPNGNQSQSPFRRLATDFGTSAGTTWMSFLALRTGQPATTPFVDGEGNNFYGRAFGVQTFYNSDPASTAQGSEGASVGRATAGANEPAGTPNDTWALVYHGNIANTKASSDDFLTPTKANSTADFLLVRFDHVNGVSNPYDDSMSVWVNPRLDNEALLGAPQMTFGPGAFSEVDRDLAFNVVRIFAGNISSGVDNYGSVQVDELKIGTSYNDVTLAPIPEPVTLAWFGLGSLMLGRRMRRK